jgi:hypothetical protein
MAVPAKQQLQTDGQRRENQHQDFQEGHGHEKQPLQQAGESADIFGYPSGGVMGVDDHHTDQDLPNGAANRSEQVRRVAQASGWGVQDVDLIAGPERVNWVSGHDRLIMAS